MDRKAFMNELRGELYGFAQMQPEVGEEVIYYLSKAKMIMEEYTTCVRMLEKEPGIANACLETIRHHIRDYVERYHKADEPNEEEDPWLEDEVDQDVGEEDEEHIPFLTLTNQNTGKEEAFYFMDTLWLEDADGHETMYIALTPFDPEEEDMMGTVIFLRVEENDDDTQTFYSVEDDDTDNRLFEMFREANFDRFHFEE